MLYNINIVEKRFSLFINKFDKRIQAVPNFFPPNFTDIFYKIKLNVSQNIINANKNM